MSKTTTVLYIDRFNSGPLPSGFPSSFGSSSYSRGGFGGGGRGGKMGKGQQPGENLRKPRWENENLSKFEKNFYVEHPSVTNRNPVCTINLIVSWLGILVKINN